MSWWFDTIKDTLQQAYELLNNEDTIGDTLSEFAYTVQTGYPRYILNNFSIRDLEKFLDHPQIDSFFIVVRKTEDDQLDYGLIYKSPSKGWRVSTIRFDSHILSVSLREYITGNSSSDEEGYTSSSPIGQPRIVSSSSSEDDFLDDIEAREEVLLILRPKTGFSTDKTRKLIAFYESKEEAPQKLSSERYIFYYLLSEPEYLDDDKFRYIRGLISKSLLLDSSTETAKICKQISVLFNETFSTYRIGLLL